MAQTGSLVSFVHFSALRPAGQPVGGEVCLLCACQLAEVRKQAAAAALVNEGRVDLLSRCPCSCSCLFCRRGKQTALLCRLLRRN